MIKNRLTLINEKYPLVYLLILLGVIFGFISILNDNNNFFILFLQTLTSMIGNLFLFFALYIVSKRTSDQYFHNYNYVIRNKNYKKNFKENIKIITFNVLYFYLIYTLLIVSISLIFSIDGKSIIIYNKYNINILLYDIFVFVKNGIILSLIFRIISILNSLNNKNINIFLIILNLIMFTLTNYNNIIYHFYNMSVIPHNYILNNLNFSSFYIDIISTVLMIFILLIIENILFDFIVKKREII